MFYGSEMRKTKRCNCHGHPKANKGEGDQEKPGDERQRGRVICLDCQAKDVARDKTMWIDLDPFRRGAKRIDKVMSDTIHSK